MKLFARIVVTAALLAAPAAAQVSSSSNQDAAQPAPVQRRGVEAAGSAVTLETSEQMFTVAAALNACGYDAGLRESLPVRAAVRHEMAEQVENVDGGLPAQRALCGYIQAHQLAGAQNLAQFVSVALFLTPDLQLSYAENQMPPDALNVDNVLPLLRTWAATIHLHAIFVEHRPDYERAVLQVHDTVTRMLLETNAYLHQPATVYDGRRFLVLLEPMLSPEAANARIYGTDYFVVLSATTPQPDAKTEAMRKAGLHLEELRHIYLLYEIDPIIYARASATSRLMPILKTVQDAPIDFLYKNDINAFMTECLIKAIEARTMETGIERPSRKANGKERFDPAGFNIALADYERRAEVVRRQQVIRDMRSGWVLTQYFYDKLSTEDREGISLKESMGELVYGMDVPAEAGRDKKIAFFPEGSPDLVGVSGSGGSTTRRGKALKQAPLTAMDQAERKLQQGDRAGAADLAEKELAAHPDSPEAMYVMARLHLMQREPQEAFDTFEKIVANGKDMRTVAWSHVYLGRMYDTALAQPDRTKAVAEYKAALAVPGIQSDVQAAAEQGLKQAFAVPQRAPQKPAPSDDDDVDAITRRQKESYSPSEEKKPQ
ncbi:tetratricopeptide repeat protein [Terriglobus sp.]|uniref:tetratricopeptide repeat protein n=1 Tax=Terriglobus sp. TaxID=1889013 RepID=UPI003AFF94BD